MTALLLVGYLLGGALAWVDWLEPARLRPREQAAGAALEASALVELTEPVMNPWNRNWTDFQPFHGPLIKGTCSEPMERKRFRD